MPVPFAGPFRPLGAPPPAPYPASVYYIRRPPVFPAFMPPGSFPGPGMYPPRPPPPVGLVPYPGTPFHPFVGPRYITQYPVCPGPPGFHPSLISPPVGVLSHQRPAVIYEIYGPMADARPPTLPVAPADKPQFKVYIGKIAPTVDNDFVLSLLQVCGPVKSWKAPTNPIDGTPTGFGFCEFESAEGSLRARRLLTKLSVDGQELVLNINQATREYLERYGEKNTTEEKAKEAEAEARDGMVSLADDENDSSRSIPNVTSRGAGDGGKMSTQGKTKRCGDVTEEDSDADKGAMQKIRSMIEERMKSKFPGPPTPPVQPSAGIVDENGDDDTKKRRQRSSALEERKSGRLCEKEGHLGERKAMGLQGWKAVLKR